MLRDRKFDVDLKIWCFKWNKQKPFKGFGKVVDTSNEGDFKVLLEKYGLMNLLVMK